MNLRHEIPMRAYMNAEIIQEALKTGALQKSTQKIIEQEKYKNAGVSTYRYQNQAYVVSLLYCLIVVPKELWDRGETDPLYDDINQGAVAKFQVIISNNNWERHPRYWLIHYLRNAVSHANYTIDNNLQFTFWNTPSNQAEPNWKVSIGNNDLMFFLSEVGSLLATAVFNDN